MKNAAIIAAAIIIPGGFVALGLWKAYELSRKEENEESEQLYPNGSYVDVNPWIGGREETVGPKGQKCHQGDNEEDLCQKAT